MENHLLMTPGEMLALPRAFLSLESDALRVYLFLLRQGGEWKGRESLAKVMNMSRRMLMHILESLEEKGLIAPLSDSFCTGQSLSIRTISSKTVPLSDSFCTGQEKETEEKESFPPAPPIKEKEYKEKEGERKISKRELSADDYIVPETRDAWLEWLRFKQQLGDSYKTDIGARRAYTYAYHTLAGCNAALFRSIVDQSIRHEWRGLFALKQQTDEPVGLNLQNNGQKEYIGW